MGEAADAVLVPDSRGGVVFVKGSFDGSLARAGTWDLTVLHLDARGAELWRRTLPLRDAYPLATCFTPSGTLVVTGSYAPGPFPARDEWFLTELGADGTSLWARSFPSEDAASGRLLVTSDRIFLVSALSTWADFGGGILGTPHARFRTDGALAVAAFDRSGVHQWSWLARDVWPGVATVAGDILVVTASFGSPWQVPGGPVIDPGNHLVAFNGRGQVAWHSRIEPERPIRALDGRADGLAVISQLYDAGASHERSPPASEWLVDLDERGVERHRQEIWRRDKGWLLRDAEVPPVPFGVWDGASAVSACATTHDVRYGVRANGRGERLLELSRRDLESPRYVLLDAAGNRSFEWVTRPTMQQSWRLALGADGSVFEAGGIGGRTAYVARVR